MHRVHLLVLGCLDKNMFLKNPDTSAAPWYQTALQLTESSLSQKNNTDNCLLLLIYKDFFSSISVCRYILWLATDLLQSK